MTAGINRCEARREDGVAGVALADAGKIAWTRRGAYPLVYCALSDRDPMSLMSEPPTPRVASRITDPVVAVADASKRFESADTGVVEAMDRVSVDVRLGEFVVIVGPSGCGKSTLLNIIAGLIEPDDGTVSLHSDARASRVGQVAYMHQLDLLLPWRDVLSNATLGLELAGTPRADATARATELAERFGIADFLQSYPAALSGGMRQRVALLRAVLPERDVLLLDEPFKALEAITRAELQRWLSDVLDRSNRATVMVTHDVEEALMLGDRVLVMSRRPGRIVLEMVVDLPRPRPDDIVRDAQFVEMKWRLMSALDGTPDG